MPDRRSTAVKMMEGAEDPVAVCEALLELAQWVVIHRGRDGFLWHYNGNEVDRLLQDAGVDVDTMVEYLKPFDPTF